MDILGTLFSSNSLVKIMRLFLLHPKTPFQSSDIMKRSKVDSSSLRTELSILKKVGFLKKCTFSVDSTQKLKNGKPKKKRVSGWCLNSEFQYLQALKMLLINPDSVDRQDILRRLKRVGQVKLLVLSGIFVEGEGSRVDILIVGNKIKPRSLKNALASIESEVGMELSYADMNLKDFMYRMEMYDKFVRDIFDYPHEKLLDKIGI